jgi:hypothetical protein
MKYMYCEFVGGRVFKGRRYVSSTRFDRISQAGRIVESETVVTAVSSNAFALKGKSFDGCSNPWTD